MVLYIFAGLFEYHGIYSFLQVSKIQLQTVYHSFLTPLLSFLIQKMLPEYVLVLATVRCHELNIVMLFP